MGLDISKWLELFPQVRPKVATLDQNFLTPIVRGLLKSWGLVSVSKEALVYLLTKSNDPKHKDNRDGFTSNAVAILVGGAQEALDSHPGQYILTLRNRKGFVKMAIRTGWVEIIMEIGGKISITHFFLQFLNCTDILFWRGGHSWPGC